MAFDFGKIFSSIGGLFKSNGVEGKGGGIGGFLSKLFGGKEGKSGGGGIIGGVVSGAATGASVGGPWGALAGGVIGLIGGLFKNKRAKDVQSAEKKDLETAATAKLSEQEKKDLTTWTDRIAVLNAKTTLTNSETEELASLKGKTTELLKTKMTAAEFETFSKESKGSLGTILLPAILGVGAGIIGSLFHKKKKDTTPADDNKVDPQQTVTQPYERRSLGYDPFHGSQDYFSSPYVAQNYSRPVFGFGPNYGTYPPPRPMYQPARPQFAPRMAQFNAPNPFGPRPPYGRIG